MQVASPSSPSTWLEILKSPAVLLAAIGLFFRLVLWPAIRTLLRQDLKPELEQVAKIPTLELRVERLENAIAGLATVPSHLSRIEALLEERR